MTRLFVYPYNNFSGGAKALARALNARIIRVHNSRYRHRNTNLVINWGSTKCPYPCLNDPVAVKIASNKLLSYAKFKEANIPHPEWTTNATEALRWIREGTRKVCGFARQTLNGHSGQGIVPFYHATEYGVEGDVFPRGLVYTKYIPKKKEFRVHVFKGEVIDVQQKRKRTDFDGERSSEIRSYDNGWVYCRDSIDEPDDIRQLAISACEAFGLDFGACDIIWNQQANKSYMLEINTAPGIEGTTVSRYVEAINNI